MIHVPNVAHHPFFINKVLLQHRDAHLSVYILLCHLHYNGRDDCDCVDLEAKIFAIWFFIESLFTCDIKDL